MVVFNIKNVKNISDKLGILASKENDAKLFVEIPGEMAGDEIKVLFRVLDKPNMYEFSTSVQKPEDFEEGKEYMKFATMLSKFKGILDVLAMLDGDVALNQKNGRVFFGGASKTVKPLDTFEYPEDTENLFIKFSKEKTTAVVGDVDAQNLLNVMNTGAGFYNEANELASGFVMKIEKGGKLSVSSADGTVAARAHISNLTKTRVGEEPTVVTLGVKQKEYISRFLEEAKSVNIAIDDTKVWLSSNEKDSGNLFVGLKATKLVDVDQLLARFSNSIGKATLDNEGLANTLSIFSKLITRGACYFKVENNILTLNDIYDESRMSVPVKALEGEFEERFPDCFGLKKLNQVVNSLKKGNVLIELFDGGNSVAPILSNEPVDGEKMAEILILPVIVSAYKEKLEKAAKKEEEANKKKK